MTCRPSGELVVSSTFANEVQLLSTRGGPAAVINHGANDKLLYNPQGLAVSADGGSLFVSDGGNNCVQKFTLSPTHGVSPVGCTSTEELHRPQGIAIEDNALFVASSGKGQIVVLDGNSLRLLFRFGSGQLLRPSDVAIYRPPHRGGPRGPVSLLYICDMGNERIAIYSTNGDALGSIGSRRRARPVSRASGHYCARPTHLCRGGDRSKVAGPGARRHTAAGTACSDGWPARRRCMARIAALRERDRGPSDPRLQDH